MTEEEKYELGFSSFYNKRISPSVPKQRLANQLKLVDGEIEKHGLSFSPAFEEQIYQKAQNIPLFGWP